LVDAEEPALGREAIGNERAKVFYTAKRLKINSLFVSRKEAAN
jgi:hypothetical protein